MLMRHHYHITIADYRGARHFAVGITLQRAAIAATAGLAAVILAGILTIVLLSGKIGSLNKGIAKLNAEKQAIESQREQLARHSDRLSSELAASQQALAELTLGLENIEALVGTVSSPGQTLAARVDNATRSALEKRLMLRSIPSGYPVASKTITSGFGKRYHPILKRERKHGGVDLRARLGTPVYATADGVVKWAGMHHGSGLGNMVEVVHNYGFSTVYGHLSEAGVKSGSYIKRGDLLGYSGDTGRSTAPHLHYEVRHLGSRLNPAPFMDWSLDDYDALFTKEDRVQWDSLTDMVRTATQAPERPWLQPILSLSANSL
ncbi:MAG TPA: peptidoglycan DD-metalloendopeptidase family protein [Wenzhouxiangella sp.]|nr:peptidoglycan DD-metalloendopeptidase family protein [Wenzhouxiangella sp.]